MNTFKTIIQNTRGETSEIKKLRNEICNEINALSQSLEILLNQRSSNKRPTEQPSSNNNLDGDKINESEIDKLEKQIKSLVNQRNQIDVVLRTIDINNNQRVLSAKNALHAVSQRPLSNGFSRVKREQKEQVISAKQALTKHFSTHNSDVENMKTRERNDD